MCSIAPIRVQAAVKPSSRRQFMGSKLLKLIVVLAISLVMFLPLSFAQKTTGDVSVAVTDPSGAAIPGAALTLTDQANGAVRKGTSDASGSFNFLQLPVGNYTI